MSTKRIEAYKTSDGQLFENEAKAEEHQQDIIGELLDTLLPDTGGNITRADRHRLLLKMLESPTLTTTVNKLHRALNYTEEF